MDNTQVDNQTAFTQMYVSGILEGLRNQIDASELSDVLVVIDGFEFKCHRVILAACSGFFKAAFTSGMKEDRERKITLKDISRQIFAEVLDCVYTGKNIITDSNMYELWHAANMLEILFLLHACEKFVKEKINNENCLVIYQHSKLLDSRELIVLSWSYIVQHFKFVREFEEMMMFTEEEMGKLFSSPDLMINSEDEVMETVLSWVAYKPTGANSDDTHAVVSDCRHDTQVDSQNCDTLASDVCKINLDQDVSSTASEQTNDNEQYTNTPSRALHLSNLLNVIKVCLLSGKCLIETMSTNIVRSDARARKIMQEGLEYILGTDRLHDFCPPSAVRRTSSDLENVIIAIHPYNGYDALVCRKQNGQWCGLGIPIQCTYYSASMTCSNNIVYLTGRGIPMYMYIPFLNQWQDIPKFLANATAGYLLSIRNCLYAVCFHVTSYQIERFNAVEASHKSSNWMTIYTLPQDLSSIHSATVIGDKLIFFGNITGELRIRIAVFDTANLRYFTLNDIPPISSFAACFKKGNDVFMLEKDGALYRLRACPKAPFIEIKYETKLWDFNRNVKGAVVFNEELWLFGPSFSEKDADKQWELSMPGVFKCVKNITCSDTLSGFMHIVIPKVYLNKVVSIQ